MYKSPVELITKQMNTQIEDYVFKAIQEVAVNIDKDELIRALEYDRGQYDKGYRDGCDRYKWISVEDRLPDENGTYLVHYHDDIVGEYVVTRQYWEPAGKFAPMEYFEEHTGRKAMHWMPLPTPPAEKE